VCAINISITPELGRHFTLASYACTCVHIPSVRVHQCTNPCCCCAWLVTAPVVRGQRGLVPQAAPAALFIIELPQHIFSCHQHMFTPVGDTYHVPFAPCRTLHDPPHTSSCKPVRAAAGVTREAAEADAVRRYTRGLALMSEGALDDAGATFEALLTSSTIAAVQSEVSGRGRPPIHPLHTQCTHSNSYPPTHSHTLSLTHSPTHSITHPLTHSLTCPLSHSLTHLFTHLPT
jgi:hypothetical protein